MSAYIDGQRVIRFGDIDSDCVTNAISHWSPEQKQEFIELIGGEQRRLRNRRKRRRNK